MKIETEIIKNFFLADKTLIDGTVEYVGGRIKAHLEVILTAIDSAGIKANLDKENVELNDAIAELKNVDTRNAKISKKEADVVENDALIALLK